MIGNSPGILMHNSYCSRMDDDWSHYLRHLCFKQSSWVSAVQVRWIAVERSERNGNVCRFCLTEYHGVIRSLWIWGIIQKKFVYLIILYIIAWNWNRWVEPKEISLNELIRVPFSSPQWFSTFHQQLIINKSWRTLHNPINAKVWSPYPWGRWVIRMCRLANFR